MPRESIEPRGPGGLAREVGSTLARYVWGQVLVSLILTALYALGLGILRVPFWYLLAPVCGFLNMVPHFGSLIALGAGILAAALAGFDAVRIAEVIGVYVVVFTLESYVLTPRILGRRLQLRPLHVFVAVLIGGAMFGFVGLLLAVPVLAVAGVIYRYYKRQREG
ncbi:MAG: AI-2E family transporter [Acidobacteriota bacterium]